MPSEWILWMMRADREERWYAQRILHAIHSISDCDSGCRYSYMGLCCMYDNDTAESVESSDEEVQKVTKLTKVLSNLTVDTSVATAPANTKRAPILTPTTQSPIEAAIATQTISTSHKESPQPENSSQPWILVPEEMSRSQSPSNKSGGESRPGKQSWRAPQPHDAG
jgi:hypothetical protein